MIQRRRALLGIGAALFAPAIVRTPGLLMPVKALPEAVSSGRLVNAALAQMDAAPKVLFSEDPNMLVHWHIYEP